jgi:predicted small secreted protein
MMRMMKMKNLIFGLILALERILERKYLMKRSLRKRRKTKVLGNNINQKEKIK